MLDCRKWFLGVFDGIVAAGNSAGTTHLINTQLQLGVWSAKCISTASAVSFGGSSDWLELTLRSAKKTVKISTVGAHAGPAHPTAVGC